MLVRTNQPNRPLKTIFILRFFGMTFQFPFIESFSETNYLILSTLYIFFKAESIRDRELYIYIYIYIWAIFAFSFCDLGTFVCLF